MKRIIIASILTILTVVGLTNHSLQSKFGKPTAIIQQQPARAQAVFLTPATDAGPILVNADHPLPIDHAPAELVNLYDQKQRAFDLASSDILLEKQVFEAMDRMFVRARKDGVSGFIITSGYRTRERQREIYAESPAGIAALPGTSEHETGLAFDVTAMRGDGGFETTKQFDWLEKNCWSYGFILRYPADKEHITGISYEPWHYRYVGVDAALQMRNLNLTLEEYLEV